MLKLTIGGIVIGLPLAAAGYTISYILILRYRERIKQSVARQKERLAKIRKKRRS